MDKTTQTETNCNGWEAQKKADALELDIAEHELQKYEAKLICLELELAEREMKANERDAAADRHEAQLQDWDDQLFYRECDLEHRESRLLEEQDAEQEYEKSKQDHIAYESARNKYVLRSMALILIAVACTHALLSTATLWLLRG